MNDICEKFREIFEPSLGTIRKKANAQPKEETDRQISQKIITPIKFIVLARKPNNSICICGDFNVAVNSLIDTEH